MGREWKWYFKIKGKITKAHLKAPHIQKRLLLRLEQWLNKFIRNCEGMHNAYIYIYICTKTGKFSCFEILLMKVLLYFLVINPFHNGDTFTMFVIVHELKFSSISFKESAIDIELFLRISRYVCMKCGRLPVQSNSS